MSSKFIILLLGTCLLVQCSYGKALTTSKESDDGTTTKTVHSSEHSSEEQLDEEAQFIVFVLAELFKISDSTLKTGQSLLKDVVAEASEIKDKSEGISERIEEHSQLALKLEKLEQNQAKLNQTEKIEQKFDAMFQLSNLLDKSNVTALENPTNDDQLFSDLLKKHGWEEMEKEYENNFVKFFHKFVPKADHFWNSLSSEEQKNFAKFEKWYQNYKSEHNVEKRIEMFGDFFQSLT